MPKYSQHQLLAECEGCEFAALFQGSKMTDKKPWRKQTVVRQLFANISDRCHHPGNHYKD
jgi:hypothetical protein